MADMPRISVTGHDLSVDCAADETILAALHRAGHAVSVGCRRGGCGVCKVDLAAGDVDYTRPVADTVLTAEERADGVCLPCRAVPVTDVEVALREDATHTTNALLTLYRSLVHQPAPVGATPAIG